ncbi:hypothetical protein PGTUg99_014960 [Puccinia graminis f. sp. tritici]|uniref:Uncharacterized protein n=1 Tax=Puccinia graminis f. sp. tritici TaxID=56615 RepID=A0A5B0S3Y6_PUCGR|nr:hypothetical protein PGTUg99_014960 [Puccinia graminis f. sp. tritici]
MARRPGSGNASGGRKDGKGYYTSLEEGDRIRLERDLPFSMTVPMDSCFSSKARRPRILAVARIRSSHLLCV